MIERPKGFSEEAWACLKPFEQAEAAESANFAKKVCQETEFTGEYFWQEIAKARLDAKLARTAFNGLREEQERARAKAAEESGPEMSEMERRYWHEHHVVLYLERIKMALECKVSDLELTLASLREFVKQKGLDA